MNTTAKRTRTGGSFILFWIKTVQKGTLEAQPMSQADGRPINLIVTINEAINLASQSIMSWAAQVMWTRTSRTLSSLSWTTWMSQGRSYSKLGIRGDLAASASFVQN